MQAPPPPEVARATDLEGLVALDRQVFATDAWSRSQIRAQLDRKDGETLVIHGPDQDVCAACCGWRAGGVGELLRMAVRPDHRRAGLGRTLLTAFLDRCRRAGADELWLELRADNAAALALYQGHRFVLTGRRSRYYADGTDALLMTWRPGGN